MEAIRVFLEIFTIREFSHWPDMFPFHNTWLLCVCRIQTWGGKMVYILLLHPSHVLKSCDRTMSPSLNVFNRTDMCWLSSAWQTIFCTKVHRIVFSGSDITTGGNPFPHPRSFQEFKNFPSTDQLANQLLLYDKTQKKLAHTYPSPEKATAP